MLIKSNYLGSKWSSSTQINPLITNPFFNEQICRSQDVRYNWVWLFGKILLNLIHLKIKVNYHFKNYQSCHPPPWLVTSFTTVPWSFYRQPRFTMWYQGSSKSMKNVPKHMARGSDCGHFFALFMYAKVKIKKYSALFWKSNFLTNKAERQKQAKMLQNWK